MRFHSGFTLIELSIVLVVIGLIVGGVLVGQDLIRAAAVRSQVSQIDKYNSAVNTFRGKYNNYLPGDLPNPDATNFGFTARGAGPGQGDGNGVVLSTTSALNGVTFSIARGEQVMFWADLSKAGLIDGNFNTASMTATTCNFSNLDRCQPRAKIMDNDYVYVYNPGYCCGWYSTDSFNYFTISGISAFHSVAVEYPDAVTNIPVAMASAIDAKIDDGAPQTGRVTASYVVGFGAGVWVGSTGSGLWTGPDTAAAVASATTCVDNGGVAGVNPRYSTFNNGKGANCALSFRFQ